MKKVFAIIFCMIWASLGFVLAQKQSNATIASFFGAKQFCGTQPASAASIASPTKKGNDLPPKPNIKLPVPCDPVDGIVTINVNVHWVLRSDGTGNFIEDDDNYVNVNDPQAQCDRINGYNRAKMLIERVNRHWTTNAVATNFFPPTPPDAPDTRIRFNLKKVNFIRDDDAYNSTVSDWSIVADHGINVWREINIFMMETNTGISGIANQLGNQTVNTPFAMKVFKEWKRYIGYIENGDGHAAEPCYTGGNTGTLHGGTLRSKIISHEFCHLLGLIHNTSTTACYDIPQHPNNDWNSGFNNIMDYTGHIPYNFTPCQIDKMHQVMQGEARLYLDNCDSCIEAIACLDAPEFYCMDVFNGPPLVDGTGSINEAKHIWWLWEVQNVGDWQAIGPEWKGIANSGQWTNGSAGIIDFRTIAPSIADIQPWKVYRLLLAVQNYDANGDFCTRWDQDVRWIRTAYCSIAPPGTGKRVASSANFPLKIYPNPAQDQLSLACDLSLFNQATAEVYNLAGQRVLTHELNVLEPTTRIWLNGLNAGAYLLRVRADGQDLAHKKLIITK